MNAIYFSIQLQAVFKSNKVSFARKANSSSLWLTDQRPPRMLWISGVLLYITVETEGSSSSQAILK